MAQIQHDEKAVFNEKMRNIAFSLCASLVLCAVIAFGVLSSVGILGGSAKSYLEGRMLSRFPEISIQTYLDKTFQDGMESYLSDNIPKRNLILVGNAYVQAALIKTAAQPFGFAEWPTYYGSEYAYSATYDSVFTIPTTLDDESYSTTANALEAVNGLISRHPECNWAFFLTDYISDSKASPGYGLVADSEDYDFWATNFLYKLNPKCTVFYGGYDDPETFYEEYFRTDHHWRVKTAYEAYCKVVSHFGKEPVESGELVDTYTEGLWGSQARSGRSIWGEPDIIQDYLPPITSKVKRNGKDQPLSAIDEGYSDKPYHKGNILSDVYAAYFHGDTAKMEFFNDSEEVSGSLLVIGDSFTNNMERFFSCNYSYVCVIDPRRYTKDLDKLIAKKKFDDVAFICCYRTLQKEPTIELLMK